MICFVAFISGGGLLLTEWISEYKFKKECEKLDKGKM